MPRVGTSWCNFRAPLLPVNLHSPWSYRNAKEKNAPRLEYRSQGGQRRDYEKISDDPRCQATLRTEAMTATFFCYALTRQAGLSWKRWSQSSIFYGAIEGTRRYPKVCVSVGGNAEAVVHGETGFVVPARDPKAIGDAILRLARDAERKSALVKFGPWR
jgi:Glycosyl transferases group 1